MCFCVFKTFFYVFLYFFNVVFLLLLKQKRTNIMHFSWAKTPFPGQSECFVEVLLTLFDGASNLNGLCSLMFLCMFLKMFL